MEVGGKVHALPVRIRVAWCQLECRWTYPLPLAGRRERAVGRRHGHVPRAVPPAGTRLDEVVAVHPDVAAHAHNTRCPCASPWLRSLERVNDGKGRWVAFYPSLETGGHAECGGTGALCAGRVLPADVGEDEMLCRRDGTEVVHVDMVECERRRSKSEQQRSEERRERRWRVPRRRGVGSEPREQLEQADEDGLQDGFEGCDECLEVGRRVFKGFTVVRRATSGDDSGTHLLLSGPILRSRRKRAIPSLPVRRQS